MPDFAVRTAFPATGNLIKYTDKAGNSVDKFGNKASKAFMKTGKSGSKMLGMFRSFGPAIGVSAFALLGKKAITLASDLTEVQNVVDVTFGKGAAQINKFASTAIEKFGLSELQAKEYASTLGAIIKPSGIAGKGLTDMAQNLTGLIGDFVSFRNLKPEESFTKIRAGITGETEPLKSLGIVMTQANLKQFALDQGMKQNIKTMGEAEKMMLRYKFIMAKSKDAQGDFNRTLEDSFANQQKVLGARFDQFLADMMKNILPTLTDLFKGFNLVLKSIDVKAFAKGFEIIVKLIPYLVAGFLAYKAALMSVAAWQGIMMAAGWIKYLWMMRSFITAATVKQWLWNAAMAANPIGLVVAGITALIAAGILLYIHFDKVRKVFMKWTKVFDNKVFRTIMLIMMPFITVPILILRNWNTLKEGISSFADAAYEKFMWIKDGIVSFGETAVEMFNWVGETILTVLLTPINLLISAIVQLLEISASIPGVGESIGQAAANVKQFQSKLNETIGSKNILAPNEAASRAQKLDINGNVNFQNAPAGTTANINVGTTPMNVEMMGAQ